jgi:hypothetical protein
MARRFLALCFVSLFAVVLAIAPTTATLAAAPPGPFFQGFEKNTNGWFDNGGTITRVPSFTASTYANGIQSASGKYHARLGLDPSPSSCASGGGPQPWFSGPYTLWGGVSSTFPQGGYKTSADIYLDVQWAQTHFDRRFDWESAISDTSGSYRRGFDFNVGTTPLGFVMTGGNNSTRCGANPADPNPSHAPVVQVLNSGWYTFEHTFNGTSGGVLSVTLKLIEKSSGTVLGTWIRSDPTDIIGVTVGGNNVGWFVQNEIDQLAIDNTLRTGLCRKGDGEGDFEDKDGHKHQAKFHGDSCGNESSAVEDDDSDSGKHFESSSVQSSTFTMDDESQTMTMVGIGLDGGLPVGFTMVVVDFGDVAPALYTLTLTDGRIVTGPLIDGGVVLQ